MDFAREAVDINLRRIPWLLVASMVLALWPIAGFWHDGSTAWLRWVLIVDMMSAGLFLALNLWVRRQPPASLWRPLYVWTAVFLAIAYMDGYYFLVGRSFGQNPVYILGVVMAATVFLLPPRQFLPVLVANHLVWSILVEGEGSGVDLLPVLIENTTGAAVGRARFAAALPCAARGVLPAPGVGDGQSRSREKEQAAQRVDGRHRSRPAQPAAWHARPSRPGGAAPVVRPTGRPARPRHAHVRRTDRAGRPVARCPCCRGTGRTGAAAHPH